MGNRKNLSHLERRCEIRSSGFSGPKGLVRESAVQGNVSRFISVILPFKHFDQRGEASEGVLFFDLRFST